MERVDGRAVGRRQRDVAGGRLAAALGDPHGEGALAIAIGAGKSADVGDRFDRKAQTERRERG